MEERQILESWKEISAYLKRSEKTCRRWEISLDLPVHRLNETPSARVFAYAEEIDRWLAEKLHKIEEAKETGARTSKKKTKRLAATAGALVVLIAVAAIILVPPRLLPVPPDKPTLAIVQFEILGGEASLEPWRTAFPDLLITGLSQSRYVTVLGITDLYRRLRGANLGEVEKFSSEDLKKAGDVTKVKFIVTGIIGKADRDTMVTVSVRNAMSGAMVKSISATFRDEKDVFAAADRIAKDIKPAVGLTRRYIARDLGKKVTRISTDSSEAFKLFSRGYRLAGIAKFNDAIPVLQKAVELDPKFALAYKQLYRSCQSVKRAEDEKRYVRKAVDLSSRLSERERGELLWLYYHNFARDAAKRKKVLERLCYFYPDDRFGSVQMLGVYGDAEEWDKALPVAEQSWAVNNADVNICRSLAQCYENLGWGDKAERVLTEFMEVNPGHQFFYQALSLRANCYLRQGKYDLSLGDVERLIDRYPNNAGYLQLKGVVELYRGDFEGAERDFRKGLDQNNPSGRMAALMYLRDLYLMKGRVEEAKKQLSMALEILDQEGRDKAGNQAIAPSLHLEMAYLHRLSGQLPEALREIDEALRSYGKPPAGMAGPPVSLQRLKALIYLEMGKPVEFAKSVEEIRQSVEREENPKMMRVYFHLLGHRELKNDNLQPAIDYFNKSLDLVSVPGTDLGADPEYFFPLAEAYARFERGIALPRTISVFEKITLPTVNRLHCGDLYAKSLFRLGKVYDFEHLQSALTADTVKAYRSKAVEYYRKFLDLWKDADPIFPEVEEAKARLAALEAE